MDGLKHLLALCAIVPEVSIVGRELLFGMCVQTASVMYVNMFCLCEKIYEL